MRRTRIPELAAALLALLFALPAQALRPDGPPPAADDGWTLEALMAELSRRPSGEARYTEIKTLTSLKQPLLAEGVLRYRFPAALEKEVHKPRAERYVIDGESMAVYRDGKLKRQVPLAEYPAMQNFASAFIATMGGDLDTLRRFYALRLEGSRADWTLWLTPTDAELQRIIKRITVRGQDGGIQSFETLQPNDDRSLMLITPQG